MHDQLDCPGCRVIVKTKNQETSERLILCREVDIDIDNLNTALRRILMVAHQVLDQSSLRPCRIELVAVKRFAVEIGDLEQGSAVFAERFSSRDHPSLSLECCRVHQERAIRQVCASESVQARGTGANERSTWLTNMIGQSFSSWLALGSRTS